MRRDGHSMDKYSKDTLEWIAERQKEHDGMVMSTVFNALTNVMREEESTNV